MSCTTAKDYSKTAEMVTKLLTKFGRELSFRVTNYVHDKIQSKDTLTVTSSQKLTGVVISTEKSLLTGSRIEKDRVLVLVSAEGAEPAMGWQLNADMITTTEDVGLVPGVSVPNLKGYWSVMKITPLSPAGVPVLYELEIQQ